NIDPTVKVSAPKPNSSTGLVKGSVTGTDRDKDALAYTVGTGPAKGAVALDLNGKFIYTPTAAARHAAAAGPLSDTFTVKVDDGHGGIVNQLVTVTIAPANTKPTGGAATLGDPGPGGVRVGTVTVGDQDGDAFTISGPAATKKGSITYDAAGDEFTYT